MGSPESLTQEIRNCLSFDALLDCIEAANHPVCLATLPNSALAYLVALVSKRSKRPLVLVARDDRDAELFYHEVSFFIRDKVKDPLRRRVWWLPSRSGHKVHLLDKSAIAARRLAALYAIRNSSDLPIIITSPMAIMEMVMPPDVLEESVDYLVVGEEFDPEQLARRLVEKGYYHVSLVEEYGDFSRRGSILDIYTPLYRRPLRLEFFGTELESIRFFHPSSQRSIEVVEDAIILPVGEVILDNKTRQKARNVLMKEIRLGRLTPSAGNLWLGRLDEGAQAFCFEAILPIFYEKMATLMDYIDPRSLVVWSDGSHVQETLHGLYRKAREEWDGAGNSDDWSSPPSEILLEPDRLLALTSSYPSIWCNRLTPLNQDSLTLDLGIRDQSDLVAKIRLRPGRERLLEPVVNEIRTWQAMGYRCCVVCPHRERVGRLVELLENYGLQATECSERFVDLSDAYEEVKIFSGFLRRGFVWPSESLVVVGEDELFSSKRPRLSRRRHTKGLFLNSFRDLRQGDYVVHVDHGIGIYKGLVRLRVGKVEGDFLQIEYQGGDRLYVPVDRLQKVQKYLGVEGQEPRVDRLGGQSWETVKRKASESVKRLAEELLQLYAQRKIREGYSFSPPDSLFHEFEATFPFDETPDQMRAIEEVLSDMTSPRPMDRLVCGDAGYGKTEVALRAAFKAIMDGKQVAMLVPTTVLAEQHFQTCRERFQRFPIRVEVLSRFKSSRQQKEIISGLEKGTVDMVIGTHRLLQDDVRFRDLGLLIIDEEHRFGVKHKEKLKKLRVSVDVLTLTATPIPRTLHMALTGIRDLSIIETAPQDRRAIETYVVPYDERIIQQALRRELERGGQAFFVHNHVRTIEQVAARLQELVPEARVGIAHGQMREGHLEKVMLDFISRRIDLLVCTTIVESGLDIPAANTIIIDRADKLGLAQIYQLRGRVGRSSEQAYAYLLIPGEDLVTRDAHRRLRALMDFSELGSGFKIALNDLQIRGGGTILGADQSGHISAVGYELYLELLERTVRRLKGEEVEEDRIDPEINIPVSAFIPASFIPDADQRLLAYKQLAAVGEESEIEELAKEWRDRFGPLPDSVRALLIMAKIRVLMIRLKIPKLEGDGRMVVLHFMEPLNFEIIRSLLSDEPCFARLMRTDRLLLEISSHRMLAHLTRIKRILQKLADHDSDIKSY